MAILIGFQSVVFAAFSKIFAIQKGCCRRYPRLSRMFQYITLEVGLVVGVLLVLAGTARGAWGWSTGEAITLVLLIRKNAADRDSRAVSFTLDFK